MNDELNMLYTIKASLDKKIDAAVAHLPEARQRAAVVNAIAEFEANLKSSAGLPLVKEPPRLVVDVKPRAAATPAEREVIINWLKDYFKRNRNKPNTGKALTELMRVEGIIVPGDHPASVVGGFLARNKEFKGEKGYWQLADYRETA